MKVLVSTALAAWVVALCLLAPLRGQKYGLGKYITWQLQNQYSTKVDYFTIDSSEVDTLLVFGTLSYEKPFVLAAALVSSSMIYNETHVVNQQPGYILNRTNLDKDFCKNKPKSCDLKLNWTLLSISDNGTEAHQFQYEITLLYKNKTTYPTQMIRNQAVIINPFLTDSPTDIIQYTFFGFVPVNSYALLSLDFEYSKFQGLFNYSIYPYNSEPVLWQYPPLTEDTRKALLAQEVPAKKINFYQQNKFVLACRRSFECGVGVSLFLANRFSNLTTTASPIYVNLLTKFLSIDDYLNKEFTDVIGGPLLSRVKFYALDWQGSNYLSFQFNNCIGSASQQFENCEFQICSYDFDGKLFNGCSETDVRSKQYVNENRALYLISILQPDTAASPTFNFSLTYHNADKGIILVNQSRQTFLLEQPQTFQLKKGKNQLEVTIFLADENTVSYTYYFLDCANTSISNCTIPNQRNYMDRIVTQKAVANRKVASECKDCLVLMTVEETEPSLYENPQEISFQLRLTKIPPKKMPWWGIVFIVISCLLVVAVLVFFFAKKSGQVYYVKGSEPVIDLK